MHPAHAMLQCSASNWRIFISASLLWCVAPTVTSSMPKERDPRGSWLLLYLWKVWQEFSSTSSKAAERTQSNSMHKSSKNVKLHQYQTRGEETKEYLLVDHDGVADGSYRQDSLNIQLLNLFSDSQIHCLCWRLWSECRCCQWRCRKGLANLETFDSSTDTIHWA